MTSIGLVHRHFRRAVLLVLFGVATGLTGCSKEDPVEDAPEAHASSDARQTAIAPSRLPQDSFKVSARSVEKRCDNFESGQRVRYKLTASEKIHVGVSIGKSLGTANPVALHLAKTEARGFTVTQTGEYCLHLDNRNSRPVQVALTLSARGTF